MTQATVPSCMIMPSVAFKYCLGIYKLYKYRYVVCNSKFAYLLSQFKV